MKHIVFAFVFFVLSVVFHILYCHRTPAGTLQAKAFIMTALANGLVMSVVFLFFPLDKGLPCTAILLYVLSIPAYLIIYVSTLLVSPSKGILLMIQSGRGASYDMLLESVARENFITLRLGELQDSGCVQRLGESFVLTASGKGIARILGVYQRILGRGPGG